QAPSGSRTIHVGAGGAVRVEHVFRCGRSRCAGNHRRIVFVVDGDVDGDVITERAIADAHHKAVAADIVCVRRVLDRLAVAGARCQGRAVCCGTCHRPGQGGAVGIGGIQRQGERGRRAVFGHADVNAVAFTDFRRVIHRRDIDGEGLGRRGNTVFTTVGYLHSDIGGPGGGAVFTRRPADCTGCTDAHAGRR